MTKDPKSTSHRQFYQLLSSVIAPRPIALVSSCNEKGNVNLAPYSFFNMVSINPPILVFSPLRRLRTNTTKDTLNNVMVTKEVVINIIGYEHVEQMSLTGGEYDSNVNEFDKSGLNPMKASLVKPPLVKEAVASFECSVNDIISFGNEGGAGNLVICEVLMAHFQDSILDSNHEINPRFYNPVGRLGRGYYVNSTEDSIFEIEKRNEGYGVGWDIIPDFVKTSERLTGNEIAMLASIKEIPAVKLHAIELSNEEKIEKIKSLINNNQIEEAWRIIIG